MAAGSTYTPISTYTVSGTSTYSYTFSSIPQTYTDLVLVFAGQGSGGSGTNLRLNSTYTNNNSSTVLYGNGTTASSSRNTNTYSIYLVSAGDSADRFLTTANIMNYTNTTTYKTVLIRTNLTNTVEASVGLWRDTSAVNQLIVTIAGGPYLLAGTTLTLYGIVAA
jgi:hypothetical protein